MPGPNHYSIAAHMLDLAHAGLSTVLLERECLAFDLSTVKTSEQTFIASALEEPHIPFNKSGTVLNSRPAARSTTNKHSTGLLLQQRRVPEPRGQRFDQGNINAAALYAEELGYPVVLKPFHGAHGDGVVTGISSAEEFKRAFRGAASSTNAQDDIIVEEHIEGDAHRVMVVGNRIVSVLISRRGSVTGDGNFTVGQLVKQCQRLRAHNSHLMSRPIRIDERMQRVLAREEAALETVIECGRVVYFTYGSNPHMGGEPAQVPDAVRPSILEASVDAVKALPGLGFGGVDFLVPDISQPLSTSGGSPR